jgi:hypothetical protein
MGKPLAHGLSFHWTVADPDMCGRSDCHEIFGSFSTYDESLGCNAALVELDLGPISFPGDRHSRTLFRNIKAPLEAAYDVTQHTLAIFRF